MSMHGPGGSAKDVGSVAGGAEESDQREGAAGGDDESTSLGDPDPDPGTAAGPEAAGGDSGGPGVRWADLPGTVQAAVVGVAARTIGAVPVDQIPRLLAPIARFTPGKRARRGSAPLARALDEDAGFRALVAQHLPVDFGADGADPVAAAARAFLLRLDCARDAVETAARSEELVALRARVADLTGAVVKLTAQLARAAAGKPEPQSERNAERGAKAPDHAEATRLRQRLREQGARIKAVEVDAQAAVAEAQAGRQDAESRAARAEASLNNWRSRVEQEARRADLAARALERLRDESDRDRADSDRRIELLLDAIQRAAAGLRSELRLAAGGADPADTVIRTLPAVVPAGSRSVDPTLLLEWLRLPGAHLIVDGYNVTKTGYPHLSLADQRDRLVRALGALAVRTGADVTAAFDGAAVVAGSSSTRQVRVVFSPPGVIADEVIRRLVEAEPQGRAVIVVTSDRELATDVRRSGAHIAPSSVLVSVLQ